MKKTAQFLIKVVLFIIGVTAFAYALKQLNQPQSAINMGVYITSIIGGVAFQVPLFKTVEQFIKE